METIMRATLCEIETLLVPLPEPIAALESLFASPLDLRVFLGELSQRCICCGSAPVIAPTNLELLQARGFGADFIPQLLRLAALVIILSLEALRRRTVPEVGLSEFFFGGVLVLILVKKIALKKPGAEQKIKDYGGFRKFRQGFGVY